MGCKWDYKMSINIRAGLCQLMKTCVVNTGFSAGKHAHLVMLHKATFAHTAESAMVCDSAH